MNSIMDGFSYLFRSSGSETMPGFNRIFTLIMLAGVLTVFLFGFAVLKHDNTSIVSEEDLIYCGNASSSEISALLNEQAIRGQNLFNGNCKSCHRINQELVGPALGEISLLRDSLWLRQKIVNGNELLRKKDKTAIMLYKKYGNTQHIEFATLTPEDVSALLVYIKERAIESRIID